MSAHVDNTVTVEVSLPRTLGAIVEACLRMIPRNTKREQDRRKFAGAAALCTSSVAICSRSQLQSDAEGGRSGSYGRGGFFLAVGIGLSDGSRRRGRVAVQSTDQWQFTQSDGRRKHQIQGADMTDACRHCLRNGRWEGGLGSAVLEGPA